MVLRFCYINTIILVFISLFLSPLKPAKETSVMLKKITIPKLSKKQTIIAGALLLLIFLLNRHNYVHISDDLKAEMFIGPAPGETITLNNPGGAVTKRTCLGVSADGVYLIEERITFPPPQFPIEQQKEKVATESPASTTPLPIKNNELITRYTQQAVGTKIIYKEISPKTEEGVTLDLAMNDPDYKKKYKPGKKKYTSKIIEESEEVILSKKRRIIRVEVMEGSYSPETKVFTFAAGLGMIQGEYRFMGFTTEMLVELRED
ncbi:hypothetical protein [Maridesulfovibrio sp.]|uniref:hypothetical protein n=1 Tax=Maridesulfovibrio sp. TaxID=2795000 RepID=UPI002AA93246|nr:hypothetical protein [Maridesulfovibrio sp.]